MENSEIIKRLNDAANIIAKKSRQSSANYIIVGSKVASQLESILDPEYKRKLREKKLKRILGK